MGQIVDSLVRTIDVGNRALVFGGSYGNLQATEAVLAYATENGFDASNTIFTGDTVAYCGQPQETVDAIRAFGCHLIMGNCEESLAAGRDDCGCGFEEDSACSILSAQWYGFCERTLSAETKSWMGTLDKQVMVKIGDFSLRCFHGSDAAINQFVFPSDVSDGHFGIPSEPEIDGYIVGHSGIPFIAQETTRLWINSGSSGMPANDGTPRVWVATLEATQSTLSAQLHCLEYPYKNAMRAMADAGLRNGYRDCLESGIWPSHDVLPQKELEMSGAPLRPYKRSIDKAHPSDVLGFVA
ncbi:MAG: metallophosphoesterase family protein [Rhizobiaceae bacterium]|nr:metallophosphoesterase family protein [Rhizobiaceae bacterium]